MNHDSVEQLDRLLTALAQGTPEQDFLSSLDTESATELSELAAISTALSGVPTMSLPRATKRYSFQKTHAVSSWTELFSIRRFLLVPTLAFAGVILTLTASAAGTSVAGQRLFTLKKVAEKTQLAFTVNPENKAKLQLEYTQKRLREAETVLTGPRRDPVLEAAVLAELSSQTQSTVEAVKVVANQHSTSTQSTNTELVASLQALSNQLSAPTHSSSAEGKINNKVAVDQINKLIASVNDQDLTSLSKEPVPFTVSGNIQTVSNNQIRLNDQAIAILDKTVITLDAKPVTVAELVLNAHVSITTIRRPSGLEAVEIKILSDKETQPTIEKKATPDSTKSTPGKITNVPNPEKDDILNQTNPKVFTGIIIEDPAPQYKP